jgi:competence protein ComEA
MIFNRESFNSWFGYTRRERRAASVLLVITIIIIIPRFLMPAANIKIEDLTPAFSEDDSQVVAPVFDNKDPSVLFLFDPNTASSDTLVRLGFSSGAAGTLVRYRNKGGRFRRPGDIRNVYGIDSTTAERLIPYIRIAEPGRGRAAVASRQVKGVPLDLNKCDSLSLVRLPGIGAVLSVRIIRYRRLLGGFARKEQLREVYGLPAETYDLISGRVFADSSAIVRIKINSASAKELGRLPYIDKYELAGILKYRELSGGISRMGELVENKLLTAEKAWKVSPYIDFER